MHLYTAWILIQAWCVFLFSDGFILQQSNTCFLSADDDSAEAEESGADKYDDEEFEEGPEKYKENESESEAKEDSGKDGDEDEKDDEYNEDFESDEEKERDKSVDEDDKESEKEEDPEDDIQDETVDKEKSEAGEKEQAEEVEDETDKEKHDVSVNECIVCLSLKPYVDLKSIDTDIVQAPRGEYFIRYISHIFFSYKPNDSINV